MKQLLPILIIAILSCTCLFSQKRDDPYAYLSTLSANERQISERFLSYASSVAHGKSAHKVENRRKDLIKSVLAAREKASAMPCFENDCSYRDSVVSFLTLNFYVLNSDFEKILNMEEIADESYDSMEAYLNARAKANEKMEQGSVRMENTYKTFATRHGVKLSDKKDALSVQIDKVDKVNDHYETVYLIFFKAYKQEVYLINALNNNDFSGAEQNRNALLQLSVEGLQKLDTVKPFQNDRSLISACRRSLGFYKTEAQDKIGIVIDFMMKNENFEKLGKSIGSKDPMLRTKEETDDYNKSVKEYNVALRNYNSVHKILEEKRISTANDWDNTVKIFLEKYIPNYN